LDLDPRMDLDFGSTSATSYDISDRWSSVTADCNFAEDYPSIQVGRWWDPNVDARKVSMAGCSVGESQNRSSRYPMIG
jgi:hypothetical protein